MTDGASSSSIPGDTIRRNGITSRGISRARHPVDDRSSPDANGGVFLQEVCSMQKLYNWLDREDGQTMAEYGVVLAVITIAVFGALALLAGNITNALTRVAGYIT